MLYLASDHAGFELKNEIIAYLKQTSVDFEDIGPFAYDALDDYPDYIIPAAQKIGAEPEKNLAIILGASGQGEAMAANKVKGVRATVFYGGQPDIIILSKTHNKANILSLGAKFLSKDEAITAVKTWLKKEFLNEERHVRRIDKISQFENSQL